MSITEVNSTAEVDELTGLVNRFVADLGATVSAGNVLIGDSLGLYRALSEAGPMTSSELADYTGTAERYVREWLAGQAAGGYITFDPGTAQYSLSDAQSLAFADPDGLCFPGAFQLALGSLASRSRIEAAFRAGNGLSWGDHDTDVFDGCERFFRPGYLANLVSSWIPAIAGLENALTNGIRVADVGCGHGASSRILASAYPASTLVGFDPHPRSIESARLAAASAGVGDRCEFAVAAAQDFPGTGYGLVATFDCLHDMGDPVTAATHIRQSLAPDGVWMIVEPFAGESIAENLNPVGRMYYSFSTFLCVPHAVSEGAPHALGNQAGEAPIGAVVRAAGFRTFRRVAETAFNIVYEARA